MKIKIDTYYDVTCSHCAKSRSTDFEKGWEMSKSALSKFAYAEGWKFKHGETLCPEGAKSDRVLRGKCYTTCPHLIFKQEDYDDEDMAYCSIHNSKFLGSADEVREGLCDCLTVKNRNEEVNKNV